MISRPIEDWIVISLAVIGGICYLGCLFLILLGMAQDVERARRENEQRPKSSA